MPPRRPNKENLDINLQRKAHSTKTAISNLRRYHDVDLEGARQAEWSSRARSLFGQGALIALNTPEARDHARLMTDHLRAYPHEADSIMDNAAAMTRGGMRSAVDDLTALHDWREGLQALSIAMAQQRRARRRKASANRKAASRKRRG